MTTVTIPDSTFQRLKAKAAARQISVAAYLDQIADDTSIPSPESARQLTALESFTAGMTAWTSAHFPSGHVVDDSRATIYEGRGE